MKVLLSHSIAESDGPIASRLRAVAATYGVTLLLPERAAASSKAYTLPKRAAAELAESDAVLALVTNGSQDRQAVAAEVTAAIKSKKPLVLLTEGAMSLPSIKSDVHAVHFDRTAPASHEKALGEALQAIKSSTNRKLAKAEALRDAIAIGAIAGIAVGLLALGMASAMIGSDEKQARVD